VWRCKGRRSFDKFSNGVKLFFIDDQAYAGFAFYRIAPFHCPNPLSKSFEKLIVNCTACSGGRRHRDRPVWRGIGIAGVYDGALDYGPADPLSMSGPLIKSERQGMTQVVEDLGHPLVIPADRQSFLLALSAQLRLTSD
jgi:hypothetical protein